MLRIRLWVITSLCRLYPSIYPISAANDNRHNYKTNYDGRKHLHKKYYDYHNDYQRDYSNYYWPNSPC
jgi:hypothetical protein